MTCSSRSTWIKRKWKLFVKKKYIINSLLGQFCFIEIRVLMYTCHMAEACARLCTSGLRPRSQSTISVPTRQWRTWPRPGTFRSRIKAEAGEADEAARINVLSTLPIIMALSLGDCQTKETDRHVNATLYIYICDKLVKQMGFTSMRGAGGLVPGGGGLLAVPAAVAAAGWDWFGGDGLELLLLVLGGGWGANETVEVLVVSVGAVVVLPALDIGRLSGFRLPLGGDDCCWGGAGDLLCWWFSAGLLLDDDADSLRPMEALDPLLVLLLPATGCDGLYPKKLTFKKGQH